MQVQGQPNQHSKTLSQKEDQEEIKQIIPKKQTNKPTTSKKKKNYCKLNLALIQKTIVCPECELLARLLF